MNQPTQETLSCFGSVNNSVRSLQQKRLMRSLTYSLLVLVLSCAVCASRAWHIAPPASKTDWEQLAKVLAQENEPDDDNALAKLEWKLWGRQQTQDALYRRYVRTARQLRNAKYAVLLAKEWGTVLGVAEMGKDGHRKRPVLGVLSVAANARRQGIGAALVQRCEEICQVVWQEDTLWVEVETTNRAALDFFEACGYVVTDEKSMVAVQRRQRVEERPHVVLTKSLGSVSVERQHLP